MSSPTALNMPTIVSQKGDRTTGSPLLDSFVLAPKANNTAYISPGLDQRSAANLQKTQSRSANAEAQLKLHSLPLAPAASRSSKPPATVPSRPASPDSRKPPESREVPVPPPDKQATVKTDRKVATPVSVSQPPALPATPSDQPANDQPPQPLSSQKIPAQKIPVPTAAAKGSEINQAAEIKPVRKRLPNPSLERAAAVGMLDLSDKLLFGGEDDALISDYLGGDDPLLTGGDETAVLKYLSKQIADSQLSKIKGRLPLSTKPQPKIDPNKIVLDAKNFKVFADAILKTDSPNSNADGEQPKGEAAQAEGSASDKLSMSEQIALLNQKVELLTKELSTLTATSPQAMVSQTAVSSANEAR